MNNINGGHFFVGYVPYGFPPFQEERVNDDASLDCEAENLFSPLNSILVALERGEITLQEVPSEFRTDPAVVLFAVRQDGLNLQYAPVKLRDDRAIVMAAVQQTWLAFRYASPRLRGDRVVALIAIRQDSLALVQASKELQKDREMILTGIEYGRLSLQFVPEESLYDKVIVLAALQRNGLELRSVPEPLCHDLEVVLTAIRNDLNALKYIKNPEIILWLMEENPEVFEYVENPEIVLTIVSKNGLFLHYASERFRGDLVTVLAAVQQNGLALCYASLELRGYFQVGLLAVQNHWKAYLYLSPELQRNAEIILSAMSQHPVGLQIASEEILSYKKWMLNEISRTPRLLFFVSDQQIILEAVMNDWRAAKYIDQELFQDQAFAFRLIDEEQRILRYIKDREIILEYVRQVPSSYGLLSKKFLGDREIAISALKNDNYVFEYVPLELWKDREVVLAFLLDLSEFWESGGLQEEIKAILIPILQNTTDRDIALTAIKETLGWAFWHLSVSLRNDRDIVLSAVRSDPEIFLFLSEELSQDPDVIAAANGDSFEGTFRIAYDDVSEHPIETLLHLLERIQADFFFPSIQYMNSPGIDAGGLSRDLISRLFKALFDCSCPALPVRRQGNKCIFQLSESSSYSEQMASYRAIGAIFAFALRDHQSLCVGMHFHEVLFSMIHSITQEEMNELRLLGEDAPFPSAIYNKLLKIYLQSQYPTVFGFPSESWEEIHQAINEFVDKGQIPEALEKEYEGTAIYDKKNEFLMDFRVHHTLLAALVTIGSMSRYLPDENWHELKGESPIQLQKHIEGFLSKQQVLESLQWDAVHEDTQRWLIEWIDQITHEQLEQFVFAMTGSFSLAPGQKLHIHLYLEGQELPSFSTCTFTMNLPKSYPDFPTFKAKLECSLSEGGKRFQFL